MAQARWQRYASAQNYVAIVCDRPIYYSGDIVQGYVMLNVSMPFFARSLNVEVVGFESTNWLDITERVEFEGDGVEDIIIKVPRHARRDLFEINVPLYKFDSTQMLAPGQYQFPFRVALPANLPGTFLYEDPCLQKNYHTYQDVVGKVRYKVTAGVVRGPALNGICNEIFDSHEILVRQRLIRQPSELVAEEVTDVSCCCFSRGRVLVRMRLDKDAYTAGETVNVILEVDNRTKMAFPEVWVEMDRIVHLVSHHGHYKHEDRVFRHRFPGLPEGQSFLGDKAQRLTFPLSPSLVPTTLASLVRCSYRVWVQLTASSFANDPRLFVPLTVYAAQPAQVVYAAPPPPTWHPQMVAPSVEVTLPSAPPLDAPLPPPTAPPNMGPGGAQRNYAPPPPPPGGQYPGAAAGAPPYQAGMPPQPQPYQMAPPQPQPYQTTPNPVYGGR